MPPTSKQRRSEADLSLRSANGRRKHMQQKRQSALSLQSTKSCWCAPSGSPVTSIVAHESHRVVPSKTLTPALYRSLLLTT